jgi:hypothetical protein
MHPRIILKGLFFLHIRVPQYRLPLNDERLGMLYGNHINIVMPIRIRHCDKKGASQQKNLL